MVFYQYDFESGDLIGEKEFNRHKREFVHYRRSFVKTCKDSILKFWLNKFYSREKQNVLKQFGASFHLIYSRSSTSRLFKQLARIDRTGQINGP